MIITILGAGNMGCALATVLAKNKHRVRLWSIEPDVIRDITRNQQTKKYLPGVKLDSKRISAMVDLADACANAGGVVLAVPSRVIAKVACTASEFIPARTPVLCIAKGIDSESFLPLPFTVAQALSRARGSVAGLAGPAIAKEFALGTPTAVVLAGSLRATKFWQEAFSRPTFHVRCSRDIIGVSWAAALKNVYAIALGMCDGMKFAMNTKALLFERSLAEMVLVLRYLHAKQETAYGLAGLGDLVTTGFSVHGRNRTFGEMICATGDCNIPAVIARMTVEGVECVEAVHAWAKRQNMALPLLETVWRVCHRNADPCATLKRYIRRAYNQHRDSV